MNKCIGKDMNRRYTMIDNYVGGKHVLEGNRCLHVTLLMKKIIWKFLIRQPTHIFEVHFYPWLTQLIIMKSSVGGDEADSERGSPLYILAVTGSEGGNLKTDQFLDWIESF